MKFIVMRFLLLGIILFLSIAALGQERIPFKMHDSICKHGKKYTTPERITINFPAKNVSDEYKIKELHRAIPDSLNNENSKKWWFYQYYFIEKVLEYDDKADSLFNPQQDKLHYKLKDTHFFDINGDGLLDFIHYPKYYRAIMLDRDVYEIFIQQKNGYKWLSFKGFIMAIKFN